MRKFSLFLLLSIILIYPGYLIANADVITVTVDETEYDVSFTAEGVDVLSMDPDTEGFALFVQVDVTGAVGNLEIIFDRDFFDSTFEGEDVEFFILLDGFDELSYDEITNSTTRILTLEIPQDTEELEIIGTSLGGQSFAESAVVTPEEELVFEEPEPVVEEPAPEPVVEEPAPEPVVEEPAPEPVVEEPECGPGTILKDGSCVLEATPEDSESKSFVFDFGGNTTNQLIIPIIFAFLIAFFVMVILWIIGRGRGKKKSENY